MLKDDDLNRLPDFEFPKDFKLESVLMNSETLDIYFLGNQVDSLLVNQRL